MKLLGHPVHPMLVVFPLGLLGTSVVFDIARWVTAYEMWALMAYYLIAVGLLSGLLAAPFGLIDWWGLPAGTRARRIGLIHGCVNLGAMALFLISWLLRRDVPTSPGGTEVGFSVAGLALALVGSWLGGEMVNRLGVGVDEGAHLDAPNSLTGPVRR